MYTPLCVVLICEHDAGVQRGSVKWYACAGALELSMIDVMALISFGS